MKTDDEIRTEVREHYSAIARGTATSCCGGGTCGSERLGYASEDLATAPGAADLGLGCGNPHAIAGLREAEVVLDLGSGGGLDCFLAARAVGPAGRAIGVDASMDMVTLARANAAKHGASNVEFRLGELEHLPVADASVDVVISNCVINLSPDKPAVVREIARVLRPGGRIAISDVIAKRPIPPELAGDVSAICRCAAGAATGDELVTLLAASGFAGIRVETDPVSGDVIAEWGLDPAYADLVAPARITASLPRLACCAPGCCA